MENTTTTTKPVSKRKVFAADKNELLELFVNIPTLARSLRMWLGRISRVEIPKELPESSSVVKYMHEIKEYYDMYMDQSKEKDEHETVIGKTTAEEVRSKYENRTLTPEQLNNIQEHERLFGKSLLNKFGKYCVNDSENQLSIIYTVAG